MTENVGWDFRTDEKFERGCTTHHVGLHRVCVDCIFGSPNMDFFEIWTFSISEIDMHDDGLDHTHGGAEIEMGSQKCFD